MGGAIVRRVQRPRSVPLLLMAGASAAGKSSVAWEIFFTLIRSGVPVATLDLDVVG
jgi:adenylylsulfate kinase-like enzyme